MKKIISVQVFLGISFLLFQFGPGIAQATTITSINPTNVSTDAGTLITITGSGFAPSSDGNSGLNGKAFLPSQTVRYSFTISDINSVLPVSGGSSQGYYNNVVYLKNTSTGTIYTTSAQSTDGTTLSFAIPPTVPVGSYSVWVSSYGADYTPDNTINTFFVENGVVEGSTEVPVLGPLIGTSNISSSPIQVNHMDPLIDASSGPYAPGSPITLQGAFWISAPGRIVFNSGSGTYYSTLPLFNPYVNANFGSTTETVNVPVTPGTYSVYYEVLKPDVSLVDYILGADGQSYYEAFPATSTPAVPASVILEASSNGSIQVKAAGASATSTPNVPVVTSTTNSDGLTTYTGVTAQNLTGVTYGNNSFVAVGNDSTTVVGTGSTASNLSWTVNTVPIPESSPSATSAIAQLTSVTYGNGTFLAGGGDGSLFGSADGVTWTNIAGTGIPTSGPIKSLAFNGTQFLALPPASIVFHSSGMNPDSTWTASQSHTGVPNQFGMCALSSSTVDVGGDPALTGGGFAVSLSSNSGVNFTPYSYWTNMNSTLSSVACGPGGFLAVGNGGVIVGGAYGEPAMEYGEPTSWLILYSGGSAMLRTNINLNAVVTTADGYVAVGDDGVILASYDGRNWVPIFSGTNQNLLGIAVADSGPLAGDFMIVGANGTVITGALASFMNFPVLESFNPSVGSAGATAMVVGENLVSSSTLIFYNSEGDMVSDYTNLLPPNPKYEYPTGYDNFVVPSLPAGTYYVRDYIGPSSIAPTLFSNPVGGYVENIGLSGINTSNGIPFTISSSTAPVSTTVLNSLSPTSGPMGTAVTISGTGMSPSYGGVYIYNSSGSQVGSNITLSGSGTATTLYIPTLAPGIYTIKEMGSGGVLSNGLSFTTTASTPASPSLSSISPTHAQVGATVTVTGSNFLNSASNVITIYSPSAGFATNISSLSPNGGSISFTIPQLNPGSYSVAALIVGGTPSNYLSFTVDPPTNPTNAIPVITSGNENTLSGGGSVLSITGTGFTATGNDVKVNGVAVGDQAGDPSSVGNLPSVYGGETILFEIPALSPGNYPLTVTNANGTSAPITITVSAPVAPVVVNSISPSSGPLGTTVTVTGSGFSTTSNSIQMTAGGDEVGQVTAAATNNGQTLTFTIPYSSQQSSNVSSTLTISIENQNDRKSTTTTFIITAPVQPSVPSQSVSFLSSFLNMTASVWNAVLGK